MAEETAPEVIDPNNTVTATVDMDVENVEATEKRPREEDESNDNDVDLKKHKVDEEKSVEEERLEKSGDEEKKEGEEEEKKKEAGGPVKLGNKSFANSLDMFHYFYNFLHAWPHHLNINKYEHVMLLELLKKGHAEPDKKIGGGVQAFQVRNHPNFKSRCFFLIREDDSVDDFSFRKCVDHILPLPEDMHLKSESNRGSGGGGGRHHGGRGGGRGRGGRGGSRGGRGGRWRN